MAVVAEERNKDGKTERIVGGKFYSDRSLPFKSLTDITFDTDSSTFVDVTGSDITFRADKPVSILIMVSAGLYIDGGGFGFGARLAVNLDSTDLDPTLFSEELFNPSGGTTHMIEDIDAGEHTVKLRLMSEVNPDSAYIEDGRLSIIFLSE